MCGIFAFTGHADPEPAQLLEAAEGAGQRGPHGHGWVTSGRPGDLTAHYRLGPLSAEYAALAAVTAPRVLGHARLATATGGTDVGALQPVVVDGHAFAHNGHVYNAAALDATAPTDSVALARTYARLRRTCSPRQALTDLVDYATHSAWAIVVLDRTGGLYAHRHYHPLYRWTGTQGVYLSSRPRHPDAQPIPENQAVAINESLTPCPT